MMWLVCECVLSVAEEPKQPSTAIKCWHVLIIITRHPHLDISQDSIH